MRDCKSRFGIIGTSGWVEDVAERYGSYSQAYMFSWVDGLREWRCVLGSPPGAGGHASRTFGSLSCKYPEIGEE